MDTELTTKISSVIPSQGMTGHRMTSVQMEKQRTPRVLRQQVLELLTHDDDDDYDCDYHYVM
jgi:hypothetical protein